MTAASAPTAGARRETLVRQTGGMAASMYASRLAVLIRGLLAARFLGPAGFGVWNALQLIWEYGQFAHLGVLNGLNKEVAYRLGKGEPEEARRLENAGLGSMLLTSILGWIILLGVVYWRYHDAGGTVWLVGALVAGAVVVIEEIFLVYVSVLRAHGVVHLVSRTELLYAAVNLAVSVGALLRFGLTGLLAAWLVTRAAALTWLAARSGLRFRPTWDRERTLRLFRRGGWIFVYLALAALLRTVDRVVTFSGLGVESLGYYALAATVAGLVAMIPNAVTFVIYPVFLRRFGETRDPHALSPDLERGTLALATGIPVLLLALVLLVPVALSWVLPGYLGAVPAMRILLAGSLFAALAQVPIFFLLAIDRDPRLVLLSAAGAALGVLACTWAVRRGYGIEGVAMGKAFADTIYGGAVLLYAGILGGGMRAGMRLLGRCMLPAIFVIAGAAVTLAILGAPDWRPTSGDVPGTEGFARALARTALALALSAPLLAWFAKRNRLDAIWTQLIPSRRGRAEAPTW